MASQTPIVLLTFSLSIFFLFIFSASADSKLIQKECSKTPNPNACVSALESDPRALKATKIHDLAKISLQLAISISTDGYNFIKSLLNSSKTKPNLKPIIKQCLDFHQGSVNSFKSALLELDEDPETANYDSKVAGDGADSCEDALASNKVQVPEISTRNQNVKLYSDIAFVITGDL